MIAERTTHDLSMSDLIIDRIRSHFKFDFIGSENTPPGLINDAALFSKGRWLQLWFSRKPTAPAKSQDYPAAGMFVSAIDYLPDMNVTTTEWNAITRIIDQSVAEFDQIVDATTHARRLVFLFGYHKRLEVSSDLRLDYLGQLLGRFPGNFQLVDPDSYGVKYEVNEWNIHPSGMSLAWEGEYHFETRIPITQIADAVKDIFDRSLCSGFPTQLPVRELQGVPCAFTLMPRYF